MKEQAVSPDSKATTALTPQGSLSKDPSREQVGSPRPCGTDHEAPSGGTRHDNLNLPQPQDSECSQRGAGLESGEHEDWPGWCQSKQEKCSPAQRLWHSPEGPGADWAGAAPSERPLGFGATPSGLRRGPHCLEGPSDSGFHPHPGRPLSLPSGLLAPRAGRHPNRLGMSVLRMWHTRPGRATLLLLHLPQPWVRGLYRGQRFPQSSLWTLELRGPSE
ncbi:uncharacterized protein [Symphalangus syndactylus]|uniref:uncharacterized protein n=1 Tax=Symphalangus syndactylus TaxID=9590 RepID=UPI0030077EA9